MVTRQAAGNLRLLRHNNLSATVPTLEHKVIGWLITLPVVQHRVITVAVRARDTSAISNQVNVLAVVVIRRHVNYPPASGI